MPRRPRRPKNACPICAESRGQRNLPLTVPFGIPTYWSPEEALAFFEFVDEMRDIILAVYWNHLSEAARAKYQPAPADPPDGQITIPDDELPF